MDPSTTRKVTNIGKDYLCMKILCGEYNIAPGKILAYQWPKVQMEPAG